jgi:hypothetical protein
MGLRVRPQRRSRLLRDGTGSIHILGDEALAGFAASSRGSIDCKDGRRDTGAESGVTCGHCGVANRGRPLVSLLWPHLEALP